MALLTRRALQELIEEAPIRPNDLRGLVGRLNRLDKATLAAEWELILVSALSRVGVVEYQPRLGGTTVLDFQFGDVSGLRLSGDITTLSDDDAVRKNPVDRVVEEIRMRLTEQGIQGSLQVSVSARSVAGSGENVSLALPPLHKLGPDVFDRKFDLFLEEIRAIPAARHSHTVQTDTARLSIEYQPGPWTTTISYPDFKSPRHVIHNPLYNRLKKKVDQIKKSSDEPFDGWQGVLVCDGHSNLFVGPHVGHGTFSFDQIARHFLRKTKSLHFVAGITVRTRNTTNGTGYQFDVRVVAARPGIEAIVGRVLGDGLSQLAQPVRTAVNARLYLERQREQGLSFLDFSDVASGQLSHGRLSLSARLAVDYLAGRIDRQRLELLGFSWGLTILKKALDEGACVTSIELKRADHQDDDLLELTWDKEDERSSPLSVR